MPSVLAVRSCCQERSKLAAAQTCCGREAPRAGPSPCSPAQGKQGRQDSKKDTVEQETDTRAADMITKGKFIMLSVGTQDNKIVV